MNLTYILIILAVVGLAIIILYFISRPPQAQLIIGPGGMPVCTKVISTLSPTTTYVPTQTFIPTQTITYLPPTTTYVPIVTQTTTQTVSFICM